MKQVLKQEKQTFPILFQLRKVSTQKSQNLSFNHSCSHCSIPLEYQKSKHECKESVLYPLQEMSFKEAMIQNLPDVSEIVVHEIPKFLLKDFSGLFPHIKDLENLKHVTICQRTENDMSFWNSKVEVERDELAKKVRFFLFKFLDDGNWNFCYKKY